MIDRDNWETPQEIFNLLDKQYFFNFDCCASKENYKCINWCDKFEFIKPFECVAFMNPPFTKAFIMFEHFFKTVSKGIAIYRCDNLETKVWQDIIFPNASWILIPKGRINYESIKGSGSRFPSALIGFGVEPPKNVKGTILSLK